MFNIAPLASVTGRILLGLFFLVPGLMKALNWAGTSEFMAGHGMIYVPYFLGAAVALEIVGGLAVITGIQARLAAFLLFLFTLIVNVVLHDFWTFTGDAAQAELQLFVKNLAVAGGLLMIVGSGPGPSIGRSGG